MVEIEEKSVYKYKPVDKKVRPVIQELLAEFRIRRKIKDDPLETLNLKGGIHKKGKIRWTKSMRENSYY